MSQAAVRQSPQAPSSAEAVQRYVAITFARYERSLGQVLPRLEEPKPSDPQRSLRRLQFLVEMLVGYAIGSTIGAVGRAMRRGFGPEATAYVSRELARIAKQGVVPIRIPTLASPPRKFLEDADQKPLLDELGVRVHVRLCLAIPETRATIAALVAAVERLAPAQKELIAATLERLANDDTYELVFAKQIAVGWQQLCAVNCGTREANLGRAPARIRDAWAEWSARARGTHIEKPVDPMEVMRAGYFMRIG